jgi:catechol 2,3-dioxygenase-like lactoylglutathione lyase family enzyme
MLSWIAFQGHFSNLSEAMFELEGLDHIALAVRDVERSAKWYVDVLGFERRYLGMWEGVPVFVGKGETALALFPLGRDRALGSEPRQPGGILHFALRADRRNFLAAQTDLTSRGIVFHFQDHEISHSIYFRDPDGYEVEVTTYDLE